MELAHRATMPTDPRETGRNAARPIPLDPSPSLRSSLLAHRSSSSHYIIVVRSVLRRRLAAAVLLALCPALVAAAMPIVHPCPVDMPWAVGDIGGHQHHQATSDGEATSEPICECVDCSVIPNAVVPTITPTVVAAVVATPVHAQWRVVPSATPAAHHLDRLPDSTAPPHA
jgi:hypothetical protein